MKTHYYSVQLAFFIWSFFNPQTAAYAFVGAKVLFEGYLFIRDRMARPEPDPSEWAPEEAEILKNYHLSLQNPFRTKKLSGLLNGFRLSIVFWLPWLLWNDLWIPVGFLIVSFFITASLSVKLNPIYVFEEAVKKGQRQFSNELTLLQGVAGKLEIRKQ